MALDEASFDRIAARTLARIERAFDAVDPDRVEPVVSAGVIRLDFQGRRRDWIVNTQRAALQIWLAAEQHAWHFAHAGTTPDDERWVAAKSGEELFGTLSRLLREHEGIELEL